MIKSMTGFGSKEANIVPFGKVRVELRSVNHKFLETVLHLPEGFLALEEKINKEIEAKIKRGRITCAINITGGACPTVFIDKKLLCNYVTAIKSIKTQFAIRQEPDLDTLIHLPGVLSLSESRIPKLNIWPHLKVLLNQALTELLKARHKEGQALQQYLESSSRKLAKDMAVIRLRFHKIIKDKISKIDVSEEQASFLKSSDITEEMERLVFHIRHFKEQLSKPGPMGKELDFIAQEMQREANTMAAKSCDASLSVQVVAMKSQIEKIREQLQNVE